MKIRITAQILAMVLLLTVLAGCGAAKAEPEVTTVETTQVPAAEATTEPTTEPTTMPTEPPAPPTLLEEQGYIFWEGAAEVSTDKQSEKWLQKGEYIPITPRKLTAAYEDVQMQFAIVGSDRKEYRDMADTKVEILISEVPGSGFDDGINWLDEKLELFHGAYQKRESSKATYEEWTNACSDRKLIYMKAIYKIDGTEHYLKTIENGVKMKDLKVGHSYPDLVDAETGTVFCIRTKYDPNKPEVGCWTVGQEGSETQIQAWFTRNYSWNVQEEKQAVLTVTFEYYVLVPADYEGISFCMQEYTTAEKVDRLILGDTGKSGWGVGSIFDEAFVSCEDYRFHFFGLKTTE